MKFLVAIIAVCFLNSLSAQNVGIGINTPVEKLEVNGKLKTDGLMITNGGFLFDFLSQTTAAGVVGFRKGHAAMGVNYIICWNGIFPSTTGSPSSSGSFIGEIVAFSGDFVPVNWKLCNGQMLKKDSIINSALYSLIGNTYGGTDSTFALPDLRGLAPVGLGPAPAGYSWTRGQKSY